MRILAALVGVFALRFLSKFAELTLFCSPGLRTHGASPHLVLEPKSSLRQGQRGRLVHGVPSGHRSDLRTASAAADVDGEGADASSANRVLLVVSDPNPYLSEGTKAALTHATQVAAGGHITAVVLPLGTNQTDTSVLQSTIRWWFNERGMGEDQYDELIPAAGGCMAAAVADAADELESTEVILAAEMAAAKRIDVSLLATFLNCRLVLVPD
mmetsp:Transcript_58305/g.126008  ORF Transcript_58305/g.126008 Transcript_58305/m.126008 type:complete len:213 (+) Transcript_58305:61-699(+)